MRVITRTAFVLVLGSTSSLAQTGSGNAVHDAAEGKLERLPESLEVRFALSALPPHLRDGAKTYVLDPQKGYVVNRNGTNGFSCIVMRKEWFWPQLTFRDDIFVPICCDEGSKKMLPVSIDVAKLRAQGSQAERTKVIADSTDLLSELCSHRKFLCLDSANCRHELSGLAVELSSTIFPGRRNGFLRVVIVYREVLPLHLRESRKGRSEPCPIQPRQCLSPELPADKAEPSSAICFRGAGGCGR